MCKCCPLMLLDGPYIGGCDWCSNKANQQQTTMKVKVPNEDVTRHSTRQDRNRVPINLHVWSVSRLAFSRAAFTSLWPTTNAKT